MFAAVSGPAQVSPTNVESGDHATGHNAEAANEAAPDAGMSSTEQAGPAVPSLGPPGPATPGMEVDSGQAESVEGEPESKRPRLSTMRVGEDMLSHVDTTGDEFFQQLEELVMEYPHELVDDENEMFYEHDDENVREMCEDDLWQPFSTLEPVLDSDTMLKIDQYANDVEIDRLKQMGVLAMHGEYTLVNLEHNCQQSLFELGGRKRVRQQMQLARLLRHRVG